MSLWDELVEEYGPSIVRCYSAVASWRTSMRDVLLCHDLGSAVFLLVFTHLTRHSMFGFIGAAMISIARIVFSKRQPGFVDTVVRPIFLHKKYKPCIVSTQLIFSTVIELILVITALGMLENKELEQWRVPSAKRVIAVDMMRLFLMTALWMIVAHPPQREEREIDEEAAIEESQDEGVEEGEENLHED